MAIDFSTLAPTIGTDDTSGTQSEACVCPECLDALLGDWPATPAPQPLFPGEHAPTCDCITCLRTEEMRLDYDRDMVDWEAVIASQDDY